MATSFNYYSNGTGSNLKFPLIELPTESAGLVGQLATRAANWKH